VRRRHGLLVVYQRDRLVDLLVRDLLQNEVAAGRDLLVVLEDDELFFGLAACDRIGIELHLEERRPHA
jgi:hypothetical protein